MNITIEPGWWSADYAMSLAGTGLQASRGKPLVSTVGKEGSPADVDHFLDFAVRILRDAEFWVQRWHGSKLTGLYFTLKGDCWLCTVKATHNDAELVAFVTAATLADTIITAAYALGHRSLKWKPSRKIVSD